MIPEKTISVFGGCIDIAKPTNDIASKPKNDTLLQQVNKSSSENHYYQIV